MKRQQSIQGNVPPKRHCSVDYSIAEFQERQFLINQTTQLRQHSCMGNQACGSLPQQPSQQSYGYNNCHEVAHNTQHYPLNSTHNSLHRRNGDWNTHTQHPASQFTSTEPTPTYLNPSQVALGDLTPTLFTSASFTPAQTIPEKPTVFDTTHNMALRGDCINRNIPLSCPIDALGPVSHVKFPPNNSQDARTTYRTPQQPSYSRLSGQGPKKPGNNTMGMPIGTNTIRCGHTGQKSNEQPPSRPVGGGVYGTQAWKPSGNRPQPPAPEGPQGTTDLVTPVKMGMKHSDSPTPSPATRAPPTPVVPSTRPSELPAAQKPRENNVRLPGPPNEEASIEARLMLLQKHVKELEREEAKNKRAQEERKREEEEKRRAEAFEWPGDPSAYPAECFANLRMPGCEFRAYAICVGLPRPGLLQNQDGVPLKGKFTFVVYAVCGGDGAIEFKLARPRSTPEELRKSVGIRFENIRLNPNFSDMNEAQVTRWSRYLLAAVPGTNDTVTMWSKV